MKKNRLPALLLAALMLLSLTGCGGNKTENASAPEATAAAAAPSQAEPESAETTAPPVGETAAAPETPAASEAPEIPGLTYVSAMEKVYATQFDVYYYEGGYKYLAIGDGNNYLIVPEGGEVPAGLDSSVQVLRQPLDRIYLAASSCISLFSAMDALDTVPLCSLSASECYVEKAKAAIERGDILFGGKYSEPDYELLVNSNVSIAIENTMILHTPKVIDKIEVLDIPVFIEYSSYEPHPLGRTEWIKLFAAMLNREEDAERVFREKVAVMEEIENYPPTGKTVAIFLIDTTGKAQVRSTDDYLSRIIEIAGGENAFTYVTIEGSGRTNVNMTMEEFYANAMDVDYLIYNSSGYSAGVDSLEKLLEKSPLLADCKAVREGNMWWIGPETYQYADKLSDLIADVHRMLTGAEGEMTFLHHMD